MNGLSWLALSLGVACLILLRTCLSHARQREQLLTWLRDPSLEIPDGHGAWQAVFSAEQQKRKIERREHTLLTAQLERFHRAAEALPDGVVLLNDQTHIEWLNAAAAHHLTLNVDRDVGTAIGQLLRTTDFHHFLARFRRGKTVTPLLLTMETHSLTLSLQLVSFSETGILLLSRDITEIARTETLRRDFIANVSHELRTPITVIAGFVEQLMNPQPPSPEMARYFIGLMADQSQRMNRLVEDLLTLSRLESGQEPLREDIVDVPKLIQQILAEGRALSKGRQTVEVGTLEATFLRGNPDELRTAFGNLVSNAVRYTPEGGRITLNWFIQKNNPTFLVTDTGIGVSAEHIPRLTERFYRVDKGRSTATGGTGLGLAIVKHVTARHQGTLEIHSQPGQGSRFVLVFPAQRQVDETSS
ncbi:MAG: phosphate regulon sensor histidine kinase PhoR [Rhodocyclaceae bacterium]|nr:phosphate regulon sensor histidine kinase PhoR [Rhodocyclaceae bacterium]